ncbi:hypothetical protein C0Q70_03569 [Pomacea canaliculata]|uniref:Uncharacterized protein n=1 Tax=Pomacea canaliculata TaxID=400727 RepID=A0A2T7PT43_POMCA|nr:hypothetical protein C0Q70_03569 [Pomacea canaliculata]
MAATEHPLRDSAGDISCIACPKVPASHLCTHCGHMFCQACTDWLRHISVGKVDNLRSILRSESESGPQTSQLDVSKEISVSKTLQTKHNCHLVAGWVTDVTRKLQDDGAEARSRILRAADVLEQAVAAWRGSLLQEVDDHVIRSTRQLERLQTQLEKHPRDVCSVCVGESVTRDVTNVFPNDALRGCRRSGESPSVDKFLVAKMDETVMERVKEDIKNICCLAFSTIDEAWETYLKHAEMPEDKELSRVTGSSESACSQSSSSSCSVASLLSVDDVQDGVEKVAQCEGSLRASDTHDNCSDLLRTGNAPEGLITLDYREDDQGRQGGCSDVSEDCDPEDSREVVSEEADVTDQGEGRVYVGTAGSVHIAQTLIEVDIRANGKLVREKSGYNGY